MNERQGSEPAATQDRPAPLVPLLADVASRLSGPEARRAIAWLLLVAGVVWGVVILTAPLLDVSLSWPVYLAGHFLCHQDPARSFWLEARQLPICARCTGLHLALPFGIAGVLACRRGRARVSCAAPTAADATLPADDRPAAARAPADPARWWRAALAVAAVPTVLSLLLEWAGGPTSGASRCLTAAPLGATVGALAAAALLGLDGGSPRARLLHLPSQTRSSRTGRQETSRHRP